MDRPAFELDIENLVNFFEVKLSDERTGAIYSFPLYPGSAPLDRQGLVDLLSQVTIYTFNGTGYDVPILLLALTGATNSELKDAGDAIILKGLRPWDFYRYYQLEIPKWLDHIDLMEVAPGVRIGLKMYMARMHAPTIQDLPIDPNDDVPAHMRPVISKYCNNDLAGTQMLRHVVADRVALRVAIGKQYRVDVRSKSDAQIAETVFKAKLDFKPVPRYIPHGFGFSYHAPKYLRFVTPSMCELLTVVRSAIFIVSDKEEAMDLGIDGMVKTGVLIPKELKGRDIRIGASVYRMGIGGLHSQESNVHHLTVPGVQTLMDIDVKSYYPSLILLMQMNPEQLGEAFSVIYRGVYGKRLLSKSEAARVLSLADCFDGAERDEMLRVASEQQTESDGLKIVLNGTFGKLFSKYSIFYAPEFGIATTITGQLSLLMLIEMMEMTGIRVVSANTDGIVLLIPAGFEAIAASNVKWWESITGLEMEESRYRAIYSRDVNNYIAITDKGKVKRKGVFNSGGVLSGPSGKGPDKDICADAIVAFLSDGVPIERTIRECQDLRKFIVVRSVTGGGEYVAAVGGHREYLGKTVRWYYGCWPGHIAAVKSGNMVAGSTNATPVMTLPATLPDDIDHQHYIDVASKMLTELGVTR